MAKRASATAKTAKLIPMSANLIIDAPVVRSQPAVRCPERIIHEPRI
jgi:hypothetical protein